MRYVPEVPRYLPVANPQNRFEATRLEYDAGEEPEQDLEILEDRSRTILSTNDSPDVGFRWSVNPYRGCFHACAYCMSGDTPILMADGRTRLLRALRVGDEIYGTRVEGRYRRYVKTRVEAHWESFKRAYRIVLANGADLVASADHRFLTERGWKHVLGAEQGPLQRPHLTLGNSMLGTSPFVRTPPTTREYLQGYLCGMIRGDGMIFEKRYPRTETRPSNNLCFFRLALVDEIARSRSARYLGELGVPTSAPFTFQPATETRKPVFGIRASTRAKVDAIRGVIAWPEAPSRDWRRGFLAGIFDAEGSYSCGVLRISNEDPAILEMTESSLRLFGFDAVREPTRLNGVANIRIRRGIGEHLRFFHLVDPAIRRKTSIDGVAIKSAEDLRIRSITDLGFSMRMFDITTGTGDFVANGIVSHNCYARPSHEYLSLGAGSDFSRKIVVKREAGTLLREAFEKKSWTGEVIVFSGVTDCYQPLESKLRLTRQCLEVCAEYKNPVGIITKSPVIERDVDLLQELARVAGVRVTVSVPFWDPEVAKALEPSVTTPERRMKIVETLAKAGIDVGVSVSPIVPGLNDEHLGDVLERAANAGARHAFYVLLRLPGAVREVFEASLRTHLPLRAEKVLRRLREAHGGKVYNASFATRMSGEGIYADMIRKLFERAAKHHGLNADERTLYRAAATFTRPPKKGTQTSFGF